MWSIRTHCLDGTRAASTVNELMPVLGWIAASCVHHDFCYQLAFTFFPPQSFFHFKGGALFASSPAWDSSPWESTSESRSKDKKPIGAVPNGHHHYLPLCTCTEIALFSVGSVPARRWAAEMLWAWVGLRHPSSTGSSIYLGQQGCRERVTHSRIHAHSPPLFPPHSPHHSCGLVAVCSGQCLLQLLILSTVLEAQLTSEKT